MHPPAVIADSPRRWLRGRWVGFIVVTAAALVLGAQVGRGSGVVIAGVAAAIAVSWAAYRLPQTFVVGALLTGMVPQVLQMTTVLPTEWMTLPGGARLEDLFLVGMAGAAAWCIASRGWRAGTSPWARAAIASAVLFFGWALLEVARNLGTYGISALGEFRFRYLIIALPLFVAVRLSDEGSRRRMATFLWGASVPLVLAAIPVIGALKGWGIGAESRYLPASISLALLYGVAWMLIASRAGVLRVPTFLIALMTILGGVMVFVDSHRSVWLVLLVLVLAFLLLGELQLRRAWAWGLATVSIIGVVAIVAMSGGVDPLAYLSTRGGALVDPLSDPTSAWRIYLWQANLNELAASPFLGSGLGGFWNVYVPELAANVTVSPHSLFVQTAVKLGAVGLALYLWVSVTAARVLIKARSVADRLGASDRVLVVAGIAACAGSLAFHLTYSLEYAGLTWIGLGLAAAMGAEAQR